MDRPIMSCAQAKSQGLKTYFTGKPCKNGHIANRAVVNGTCFKCSQLSDIPRRPIRRARRRREKLVARESYDLKMREKWGDRYMPYREALRLGLRYYFTGVACIKGHLSKRDTNSSSCVECRLIATRKFRGNPPRKILTRVASNTLEGEGFNPEARRANLENLRAKRRRARGTHSALDIRELLRLQKGKCAECQCRLKGHYHVDHRIPLSLGGDNSKYNLQLTCPSCNCTKGATHPLEWARRNGRLL